MATVATMATSTINTRKMQYTGDAMKSMKTGGLHLTLDNDDLEKIGNQAPFANRDWGKRKNESPSPHTIPQLKHNIGRYPLTSRLASWLVDSFIKYEPPTAVKDLVRPFSAELHELVEKERAMSTGFHDLDFVEMGYQISLEVNTEILIAATERGEAAELNLEYHTSRADRDVDDHFNDWAKLVTGIDCDPPIMARAPFFLMLCQAFAYEANSSQEDYVYAALTAIDWVKGDNAISNKIRAFVDGANAAIPTLDDKLSGKDRSFWRIAVGYLKAMNKTETSREFSAPRQSYIKTNIDPYLLVAARGFDTTGSAFMCTDGAAFYDSRGMDSLVANAIPHDLMDLHTDVMTGETRNLYRLLYPNDLTIQQSIETMSIVLSSFLCELFRGHKRARFENREDGRISAASAAYSFTRARQRHIFENLEAYMTKYPQFWDWTWDIYGRAKEQMTEAGLDELVVHALVRGINQTKLPESTPNNFFHTFFDLIENGHAQMQVKNPLNVPEDLAEIFREIHSLWHEQLLDPNKKPGWGRAFDEKTDALFGHIGEILLAKGGINDETYKFAIAYGRLSMSLPYVAYHTIDAIIIAYGPVSSRSE